MLLISCDAQTNIVFKPVGNCAIQDNGNPVCIYSGGKETPCDTGVCAYSEEKTHPTRTLTLSITLFGGLAPLEENRLHD